MGRHLSPRYGQVIIVSAYPVLTAVNWSQHWCAICVQYQSSCAPKLARKCEIEHWFPCGADGRSFVRRMVTWLPNFLGWVDLLTHGAPQARLARRSSAKNLVLFYLLPSVPEAACGKSPELRAEGWGYSEGGQIKTNFSLFSFVCVGVCAKYFWPRGTISPVVFYEKVWVSRFFCWCNISQVLYIFYINY